MKFTKMHGCGNDYVYVNLFEEEIKDVTAFSIKVSDRHFGVGGDGAIFINPSDEADFEMEMYNADGTRAEMCGNGIRSVGKYVYDYGLTDKTQITVASFYKVKYLDLTVENGKVSKVKVDMGTPILKAQEVPVVSENEQVVDEKIVVDGKEYHHIIDPDTLYPAEKWKAVSVVCEDSGLADALSTALFLLSQEEGQKLLDECNACAIWVAPDDEIYYSTGFKDLIKT